MEIINLNWKPPSVTVREQDTHDALIVGVTPATNVQCSRWSAGFSGQSNRSNSARESKGRSYFEQRYIVIRHVQFRILVRGGVVRVYLC